MKKTILIVGGGVEAVPGIVLAEEMGLHVVVSDMNPEAPGFSRADDRLLASTYDVDATLSEAIRFHNNVRPLDAVMCMASDVPLTVAVIAEKLGLPGIPVDSARLVTDKLAMKRRFVEAGVPVPWFSPVESFDHLREIAGEQGYPLVLKPVDSRGSKGVLQLRDGLNLKEGYELSLSYSPTDHLMVERFLSGQQISTESIVQDGILYTPGFADRNYEYIDRYFPYFIENGGELPSAQPRRIKSMVKTILRRAAAGLGIDTGVVKGDIVIHEGKPHIIEVAGRLSGGYLCTHDIPFNNGINIVEGVIRISLGERVAPEAFKPKFNRILAKRWVFPEPGRVVKVTGEDQAASMPGIVTVVVHCRPGDIIHPPTDSAASPGFVTATAENRARAINRAREAVAKIVIETESQ
ncbi:ATP-grasp domain-containing protein [candidate division KSB1 bacterium]